MEQLKLPSELYDFFDTEVGRSLMIKGKAGTGKTILSLSIMEAVGDIDNSFYLSTRVANDALYSQFEWLKKKEWRENLLDASMDLLSSFSDEEMERDFREKKPESMEKVEKAREMLKHMKGGQDEWRTELPERVERSMLDSLEKDILEVEEIYQRVDNRLPEHCLVIIDSLEALVERYEISPSKLIKILQKDLVEKSGVRLILVLEEEAPTKWDYLVDGIITMQEEEQKGRRLRRMYLNKLRGMRIDRPVYLYTLHQGRFGFFEPFKERLPAFEGKHEAIDDGEGTVYEERDMYSTGSEHLDKIIGGGYPRDGLVLLDIGKNVPTYGEMHMLGPVMENFLLQERGVLNIPLTGKKDKILRRWFSRVIGDDIDRHLHSFKPVSTTSPIKESDFEDYRDELKEAYKETKYRSNEPTLTVFDWESIEDYIGNFEGDIDKKSITRNILELTMEYSGLNIGIIRPGLELSQKLKNIADVHLKVFARANTLLIHGEKPNTGIYNVKLSDEEHPEVSFIPLV